MQFDKIALTFSAIKECHKSPDLFDEMIFFLWSGGEKKVKAK